MKHRPNFYFESAGEPYSADPAAPSQVQRGAAGSQYRFGSGPRRVSSPLDGSAYDFLKRSQIAQAAIDIFALSFLLFFVFIAALSIIGSVASFVLVLI